ncbi:MupG family TIM beta-alpha barrel fold protein [Bacillus sp. B15-48]|uniref:DUF871 domain-containing protein n=1 Tax=Bacillus sp. B15-48 TaxID=1548601 RepID=UPI00193F3924|nr:MupG family TIM beta-alpha barrel fold protein [Bacillus sp. B15-48]MBM4761138.1 DUF871 family protein [Bacillus sp. B15-48]
MLGFSIFLTNPIAEEQKNYIETMSGNGFKSIFTSLHIPEEDPTAYKERLQELGALAIKNDLELMADISPQSLGHLGFTWENAEGLLQWGVTGLRVDYGVSEETIAALSRKMKIALNASTLTKESVEQLKQSGIVMEQTEAWHNYYPRPETGLDRDGFNEMNRWLKEEGISVMAFIPGDGQKRGPLYEGLPTLEDHRGETTFVAFLDFEQNQWVDKILIGDPSLCEGSFQQFLAYQRGVIQLRAHCFTEDASLQERCSQVQTNRQDAARDVIRSVESRQYGLPGHHTLRPQHTVDRPIGSITIDNEKYGRYQGEMQVTKRFLAADEKVNVIGRIVDEDLPLLKYVTGGQKFEVKFT